MSSNYAKFSGLGGGGSGGSGTVTSVGLSDGSSTPIYSISGSPVTTSGTLTFTLANETANYIFAGPTSGSAAQPTFRGLVAADLPSGWNPVSIANGGTGQTTELAAINALTAWNTSNVFVGNSAATSTTATGIVSVGYQAGKNMTSSCNQNTFIGYQAGYGTSSGPANTFVGCSSGFGNGGAALTGSANVGLGYGSLYNIRGSASRNMGEGYESLVGVTTGTGNVGLGYVAGQTITTGTDNMCLGTSSDVGTNNLTNASAIGYNTVVNASNTMILGNGVNIGIDSSFSQTASARLSLPGGTATANTAPLKIHSGTNLTSPEAGAIESDGTNLYWTSDTPTRYTLATTSSAANTALSNLSSTSVNADIIPASDAGENLGSASKAWSSVYSKNFEINHGNINYGTLQYSTGAPDGITYNLGLYSQTGNTLALFTLNAPGGSTGNLFTGTGNAGSGNSGNYYIRTGTATGTRGGILLQDGSEGSSGYFWKSKDTSGTGNWATQFSGLTTDGVIYASSATAVGSTAAGTTDYLLTSNGGSGSAPSFKQLNLASSGALTGQLTVSNGGTGASSFTEYTVLCGGTTTTGALQNVASVGSSGQVLTSNGASALPTWNAPVTNNCSYGSWDSSYAWNGNTTTSTFTNLANSASGTFTANNNGITVSEPASHLFGITFTPSSSSSLYFVCLTLSATNTTSGRDFYLRLTDGSIIVDGVYTFENGQNFPIKLSGIYAPGTTSPVSLVVQYYITSGTVDVGAQLGSSPTGFYNIFQIK